MTNTTTTSVTELVSSELIMTTILEGARNLAVAAQFCNQVFAAPGSAKVVSFPRKSPASVSGSATVGASEGNTMTASQWQTVETSVTAQKIYHSVDLTQEALEDNILAGNLYQLIVEDTQQEIAVTADRIVTDLFSSVSNSVGTSGQNLAVVDMAAAATTIMGAGMPWATGELAYVIHTQQAADWLGVDANSTSTRISDYFVKGSDPGMGVIGTFLGNPVVATANCKGDDGTPTNRVGCCFIRGDLPSTKNRSAFGVAIKRQLQTNAFFDVTTDIHNIVSTYRFGAALVADEAACKVVTDA